jgi:anti-sigma factor RsiW
MAATAAVTWMAAVQFVGLSATDMAAMQVISGHSRSMITGHLADVTSSDQHTVKPWLSAKLDFSPPATDLTTAGFPLVGGRVDYVESRPVAVLVYRHRQHMIDLFVWPAAGHDRSAPTRVLSKNGYHLLHWVEGGMVFWVISDLNPKELEQFVAAFSAAQ